MDAPKGLLAAAAGAVEEKKDDAEATVCAGVGAEAGPFSRGEGCVVSITTGGVGGVPSSLDAGSSTGTAGVSLAVSLMPPPLLPAAMGVRERVTNTVLECPSP